MKSKSASDLFLKKNWVSREQFETALEEEKATKVPIGSILLGKGWITSGQLSEVLAEQFKLPFVKLRGTLVSQEAISVVALKVALHFKVMPIQLKGTKLTVAMSDPRDIRVLDGLRLALQQRYTIDPVLATEEDILEALKEHYGVGAETIDEILADRGGPPVARAGATEETVEDIQQLAGDASIMKLVNQLILEAHRRRATDIHLEPYRGKVRLRYRVDGILQDVDVPSSIRQLFLAIVSRIKVLSNMNLVERRLPQDGRAGVKVGKEKLDLRISVLPTPAGESVVIRILPNEMFLDFKDLGFREEDLKILGAIIRKPHGLVFVTGPTGSGKTTTLYACLNSINTADRKIITIEDPIEYELEGISQIQINPGIGLTFAQGLRSMLRHDPDVMMVGEVRDLETAELAFRIALTGHLVFSTLHTNDATSGITRLLDMGIDPYLITSSVECIVAQRLVRMLCSSCKEPSPTPLPSGKKGYRARGCEACHRTGYLGRRAIYEFFLLSPEIEDLILKRATADAIRHAAVELGMQTMREDGWLKVGAGLTTLDEVLRVTQEEQ